MHRTAPTSSGVDRPTSAQDLPPGHVVGAGRWAVGNAEGTYFAVSRRCRHLRAELANGTIDDDGCLVCPWHGARYDVASGHMVTGPQGAFAKVPGLGASYRLLTRVAPLRVATVSDRKGTLYVR
jgi:3-phenylpropionate/trans-cinnamate dioxygenase ferredoxin component